MFLVLCKGLKSYGKAVLGLVVIPLVIFFVLTCKFLTVIDFTTLQVSSIFSKVDPKIFGKYIYLFIAEHFFRRGF